MSISEKALAASLPAGFRLAKRVTNEQLKLEEGRPYCLRIDGPIHQAQPEKTRNPERAAAAPAAKKQPPHLAMVTWYRDGEAPMPRVIIVPAVLQSELEKAYGLPEGDSGAYIGKTFVITRHKVQGKDYNLFEILEVEPDTGAEHDVSRPGDQSRRRK